MTYKKTCVNSIIYTFLLIQKHCCSLLIYCVGYISIVALGSTYQVWRQNNDIDAVKHFILNLNVVPYHGLQYTPHLYPYNYRWEFFIVKNRPGNLWIPS